MTQQDDTSLCACVVDPMASACGEWDGNASLCICAEDGLNDAGIGVPP